MKFTIEVDKSEKNALDVALNSTTTGGTLRQASVLPGKSEDFEVEDEVRVVITVGDAVAEDAGQEKKAK